MQDICTPMFRFFGKRYFSTQLRGLLSCDQRWLADKGKNLRSCLTAAEYLGVSECDAIIFASKSDINDSAVNAIASIPNLRRLILATSTNHANRLAPYCGNVLVGLFGNKKDSLLQLEERKLLSNFTPYAFLMGPSVTFTKDVFPRVAAQLEIQPVTDIVKIKNASTFVKPMYSGSVLVTLSLKNPKLPKILTIRTPSFPPIEGLTTQQFAEVIQVNLDKVVRTRIEVTELKNIKYFKRSKTDTGLDCKVIEISQRVSERPSLSSASIVIGGGRGFGNKENFDTYLEPLAKKLNAALGLTRSSYEFHPNYSDLLIGQSGQIIAPDLYLAIGLSGAIQHLAGIKDSKMIVAINQDKDAPIFEICDYGLIGDLFEILPALTKKLPPQEEDDPQHV